MRQNLIVALLAVCATLLAVNVIQNMNQPPVVFGQAAGNHAGNYVMATGVTTSGSEAVMYIFDVTQKKVAAYSTKNRGIEFKGVRTVQHDFKADWLVPRGTMTPEMVQKATTSSTRRR